MTAMIMKRKIKLPTTRVMETTRMASMQNEMIRGAR